MNDPFLIDECLSLELAALALSRGHYAVHVSRKGLAGKSDEALMPIILRGNFVLVTNNRTDFLKLYAHEPVHPGLVIIIPGNQPLEKQVDLFSFGLNVIESQPDLINKLVEIDIHGAVTITDWPPEQADEPEPHDDEDGSGGGASGGPS